MNTNEDTLDDDNDLLSQERIQIKEALLNLY